MYKCYTFLSRINTKYLFFLIKTYRINRKDRGEWDKRRKRGCESVI